MCNLLGKKPDGTTVVILLMIVGNWEMCNMLREKLAGTTEVILLYRTYVIRRRIFLNKFKNKL